MDWQEILSNLYNKEIKYRRAFDPLAEGIILRLYLENDSFLPICLNMLPSELPNIELETEREKLIKKIVLSFCSDKKLCEPLTRLSYAYEKYKTAADEESFFKQPNLSSIYDLENTYGLIKLSDDIEFFDAITPIRIVDSKKQCTIVVKTNEHIARVIFDLRKNNYAKDLFVRGNDNLVYKGVNKEDTMKHLRGFCCPSKYACDSHPSIVFYYDQNAYGDQFWIKKTEEEMFFEELYQDCEPELGYYTTQLVHIRYKPSDNGAIINHIDHEYIYYTPEEFDARKKTRDMGVKGTARRRQKTFKVDNAYIPEQYKVPVNVIGKNTSYEFVPFVLYSLFVNTTLLDEYYNGIAKKQ